MQRSLFQFLLVRPVQIDPRTYSFDEVPIFSRGQIQYDHAMNGSPHQVDRNEVAFHVRYRTLYIVKVVARKGRIEVFQGETAELSGELGLLREAEYKFCFDKPPGIDYRLEKVKRLLQAVHRLILTQALVVGPDIHRE